MNISRPLIWALVLLWLSLAFKYWVIAGFFVPIVLVLTLWIWVRAERDVRGRS
jgi:hypothetical protein